MYLLWLLRCDMSRCAKKKVTAQQGIRPLTLHTTVHYITNRANPTNLKLQSFYSLFKSFSSLMHPCIAVSANAYVFRVFSSKNNSSCKLVKITCLCQKMKLSFQACLISIAAETSWVIKAINHSAYGLPIKMNGFFIECWLFSAIVWHSGQSWWEVTTLCKFTRGKMEQQHCLWSILEPNK